MLRYAVGRSGGLSYHLKALRRADGAWRPFRASVRGFLESTWAPPEKDLIVFGPSAAWTLPLDWLARFDRVIAVEPDPLARLLLARRLPDRLEFDSSPARLPWFAVGKREEGLREILARSPGAAVLFSNVLGQVRTLATLDDDVDRECRRLFSKALEGRNWASYHDVLSSTAGFKSPFPEFPPKRISAEDLARHYFSETDEIADHDTLWLSEDRRLDFAPWALQAGANHLIGFVSPKAP